MFKVPRVLFLSHTAVVGGAELSLLDLLQGLGGVKEACDVRVLLFEKGDFEENIRRAGIDLTVVPSTTLRRIRRGSVLSLFGAYLRALMTMLRATLHEARSADLIYANTLKTLFPSILAGILLRKPVLWHVRDLMSRDTGFGLLQIFAARWFCARADAVIANSDATRIALGSRQARRAITIYNGIPDPLEGVATAVQRPARHSLSLVMPGRLTPWKGQDVLLRALKLLPSRLSVHVSFLGAARAEDEDYALFLRTLAAEVGPHVTVDFLGSVPDVSRYLVAADVVVHASTMPEPFGRVIIEGMAAGAAVVAAKAGGVPEIVEDRVTGLLYPPGNAEKLLECLVQLAEAPEWRIRLGDNARKAYLDRFTVDVMVHQVKRTIDATLTGRRA